MDFFYFPAYVSEASGKEYTENNLRQYIMLSLKKYI